MKSIEEQMSDEIRCTNYCAEEANKRLEKDDYIGAAIFLENVTRSLRELDKLQKQREDLKNGKIRITASVVGFGRTFS